MLSEAGIKKRLFFIAVFFFSLSAGGFSTPAPAADSPSLPAVDELISKNEYNEALKMLAQYQKLHPEDFDAAQKRVKKIMKERERFNRMAQELARRMEAFTAQDAPDESQDSEKVEIIGAMEKIETRKAEELVSLTNDARRTLTLQYYIARANESMNEGAALVESGESDEQCYAQAAAVFARCLTLKTAETDVIYDGEYAVPVVYDAALLETVTRSEQAVSTELEKLSPLLASCERDVHAFQAAVQEADVASSFSCLEQLERSFRSLIDSRNKISAQGTVLSRSDEAVSKAYPTLGTSFISFARLAVDGTENRADTGIVAALDRFIETRLEMLKKTVFDTCAQSFAVIADVLPGDFSFTGETVPHATETAADYVARAASFARSGMRVSALYALVTGYPEEKQRSYTAAMAGASGVWEQAFVSALVQVATLAQTPFENASPAALLEDSVVYRKILSESEKALHDERLSVCSDWNDGMAYYTGLVGRTADECRMRLERGWQRIAASYAGEADSLSENLENRVRDAELLSGLLESDGRKAPTRAQLAFKACAEDIQSAVALLSGYSARLSESGYSAGAEDAFFASHRIVNERIASLTALQLRTQSSLQDAQERASQAKLLAVQGDDFFKQAEKALSSRQFDTAVDFLLRARERYSASLSLEYDEALQKRTDSALLALDSDITKQHHLAIVEKVRALKTQARKAYYDQDFSAAESSLVEAGEEWAKTSVEEDAEIKDLLELVNTALSMSADRTIPVSAPQYSEMSSLLNLAHLRFDEGAALLQQGNTGEAKAAFSRATEQIRKVQRLYPLNSEASLLSLRIEKLLHPESFEKTFAAMVKKALASLDKKTAYATLSDLYAINPNYPKLAKNIENLEYELGLRVRPVDTSTKKKSQALVTEASKALKAAKNNTEKLRTVLASVNSALSVDPDNAEAMRLKDSVQVALGPQVTNVLSSEDETVYLVAIQELNKNNIIRSYAMIEQLMQKNNNSSNRKLQQLMKRIKALM